MFAVIVVNVSPPHRLWESCDCALVSLCLPSPSLPFPTLPLPPCPPPLLPLPSYSSFSSAILAFHLISKLGKGYFFCQHYENLFRLYLYSDEVIHGISDSKTEGGTSLVVQW